MTQGLYCLCENGMVINTSTTTGVLRAALTIATANSGTLSYPDLAGRTVFVQQVRGSSTLGGNYSSRALNFTINYGAGYPVISYSPTGTAGEHYFMHVYILVL